MPKLNTRQIVIIGAMVLATAYGIYDFMTGGRRGAVAVETGKKAVDLTAYINDLTAVLAKNTASPLDVHLIRRAEEGWRRNPFYERASYKQLTANDETAKAAAEAAKAAAAERKNFSYTGYMTMGKSKIAVINGHEYATGDTLDVGGYVLKRIAPDQVAIHHEGTGRTMDIPLQEPHLREEGT